MQLIKLGLNMSTPDTFPSLFWGYNAIWLILGIYLYTLLARVKRIEDKLQRLEKDE